MVYHENCYCPMTNIEKWYVAHDCPDTYEQIDKDLSIFKRVNLKKVADEAVSRFNKKGMHSLTHYRIINNKVHRCYRCHSCSTCCHCKQIEDWGKGRYHHLPQFLYPSSLHGAMSTDCGYIKQNKQKTFNIWRFMR